MATTPNYGFIMPDPTDFVTDLPADFEIFGDEVDLRVKALNPETTEGDLAYRGATADAKDRLGIGTAGQVLAVNIGATAPEWVTPVTIPITTEGDLIIGDATGVPIRLAVGTVGQILVSDGDTVSYVTPSAASKSYSLLSTTSLTAASTITVSGLSGYDDFLFMVSGWNCGTASSTLEMRFNGDTGTNYRRSGFSTAVGAAFDRQLINHTSGVGTRLDLGTLGTTTGGGLVGAASLRMFGANSSGDKVFTFVSGTSQSATSTMVRTQNGQGVWENSAVVSSVSVISTAGNFNGGDLKIYAAV